MLIILDNGLNTERRIDIDNVDERPIDNRLSANKAWPIGGTIPTIDLNPKHFSTIDVYNGLYPMPIYGTYNTITNFQTSEYEGGDYFNISISFGYEEIANE